MKIFDTHAHYDDDRFDEDRDILLGGELCQEITIQSVESSEDKNESDDTAESPDNTSSYHIEKVTNIGCNMKTSRQSVRFAQDYDFIYASIGVIPHHVDEMTEDDLEELRQLAKNCDKVVAIGEIGLDYYYDEPPRELQHKWFLKQMELAKELGLPLVIHSRDAAQDTLELMKQAHAEDIGGVVHCYSYSEETAREFLKMGFYFGIGGVVTFKNSKKLKRAVKSIPIEKIVLETDSPYLAPTPFRGERNDSRYIPYVINEIARLKEISPQDVAEICYENSLRLYRI